MIERDGGFSDPMPLARPLAKPHENRRPHGNLCRVCPEKSKVADRVNVWKATNHAMQLMTTGLTVNRRAGL